MAQLVHVGTMLKDYEEYTEFDEEPQAHTEHVKLPTVVSQKQGFFRSAIPIMPLSLAVFCCIINVVIPGSGTMLAGVSVSCCSDPRGSSRWKCVCINLLAAILQLLLCPLLIGFIWSLIWGIMFIQIARNWFISDLDNRIDCIIGCPCSSW